MITEEEIKKSIIEIAKTSYKENFNREVTEEEIATILKHLLPRMEKELKEIKKFSDAEYKIYMGQQANKLLFSPGNIIGEASRVVKEIGVDKVLHMREYKRLREMELAARFCIANRKTSGDMLMIMPQDSPDIILILPDDASTKNIKALPMEVMTIPEIVKGTMVTDLPTELANFIKEKKFKKAYGEIFSLLVGFDFTQQALNFNKISEELNKIPDNPYQSIFATFTSSEDGKTMSVIQLYPGVAVRKDYNLEEEQALIY